jgi:uncharacterized protein YecE (DUF72 family)
MNKVHIGTQGWNYDDWVGGFYPAGTRASDYFQTYAEAFDTVEIDSTFYAVPSEAVIETWRKRAPQGFRYALKLPQEITHKRRLNDCAELLEHFCKRVRGLKAALGTVLIQCPPDLSPRVWRTFEKFMALLPIDMRFSVEFRDRAWLEKATGETTLELMREHGITLALIDSPWIPRELTFEWMQHPAVTNATFAYVRWMGTRELTVFSRIQIDRTRELLKWAEALQTLRQHVPLIDGYFNNHYQGHSPASATHMKRLLGLPVVEPAELIRQPALF